ncbi:hypothetical protein SS50377_24243 [Spironucleus salmonicida]|uniref:Uncharacterized protein n=1 Tax=Spironucleus salmonicida TaxID=348837 RepID=A0A9P8LTG3_9EUKA|nr:hypothetical protein SS50377_24228 [Spironucleus salmonicida]KAH0574289.1 hypothetical protein SS50377_24243 [Spironucleus salmonicida]
MPVSGRSLPGPFGFGPKLRCFAELCRRCSRTSTRAVQSSAWSASLAPFGSADSYAFGS